MNTPRFQTIDASLYTVGDLAQFDGERFLPFSPVGTIEIGDTETVLDVGAAKEVTVSHETVATFLWCQHPEITAINLGVRVQVLAARSNGDATNNGQFVLLIEDLQFDGYNSRDIDFTWSRLGGV